jgi:hypothetical protein
LDGWDHESPILLQFNSARGAERNVLSIAERLPRQRGFPLLIAFGLLSHPAILLRELGFALVPTYLDISRQPLPSRYQSHEWPFDLGDDPVSRIRGEPVVYVDAHLRVVPDREPIVPGHFLVVGEASVHSFADGAASAALDRLLRGESHPAFSQDEWIFIERGRARFCTSGFTNSHAHGHLLPASSFDGNSIADLANQLGARRFDCLETALLDARCTVGEYVLVVDPAGNASLALVPEDGSLGKRFIRRFFEARVR